jgi:predicted nucleic-acid-binding Zn-ribbon protein
MTLMREVPGVGGGEALMKNTKRCPKCQSSDIVLIPGKRDARGTGNLISVSRWNIFSVVKPTLHVFCSCGYLENWLMSREDIARVKAMYAK